LAGRAIGNDFAATRYARRAQKLKDEYEARAAQEGKPLEQYMPEIEQRLEELAVKVGATRRGVKGDDGRPIDRSYRDRFYEDADLGAQRRASRQVLDGNVAEGYRTMAESRGAMGRLGDTLTFGQAAGETAAVAGAIDPKSGAFDPAKAATGRAANAAKFGQGDIANTQYQQARQFRLQAAAGIGGQLLNAMFDAQKAPVSNDYVRGLFEGMKPY
ncbi:hypothetical protein LPQ06_28445, partial [Klebsiella pneumoniae]|nr:hypothetical protein [Klebsiella pneumoniae]